jgi:tripartite-type tricarboxylate transporter receptor subunit TctC
MSLPSICATFCPEAQRIEIEETTMERIVLLLRLAVLLALAAASEPAAAQDYPTRPIRFVVGFTAGGPTDRPARFIADKLSDMLGKPVIVENKPGAASMIAIRDVLSRPRDGYSLSVCTYFDPVNPLLYRSAGYGISDIEPVTLIAKYDYAIALTNDIPARTMQELIAYAKQNPDKLNYGHLGVGSTQNMLAKKLEKMTGMKMTGIPYKGAADAVQEIVAGRNHLFIGPPIAVMPLFEGQKLKVIAVTGAERLSSAPDIPTLGESGIPFVAYAWLGICAGSGTPKPIVDLLSSRIGAIVSSPEYRALVEKSGSVAVSSTPQEFKAEIDKTVSDAAPIIQEFGLQTD